MWQSGVNDGVTGSRADGMQPECSLDAARITCFNLILDLILNQIRFDFRLPEFLICRCTIKSYYAHH